MIDIIKGSVRSFGLSRMPLLEAAFVALKNISIPNGPALITFWGNKGVGKTALLEHIAYRLSSSDNAEIVNIHQIDRLSLEQIKQTLKQKMSDVSRDKTAVVLLDDLDELLRKDKDGQSFFDFERNAIQPLIERGNVLILCTSQIELNQWREDDVRIRQVNYQILPMTPNEVVAVLSETKIAAKEAYRLTFGHPKVANWLLEDPTLTDKQIAEKAWDYFLEDIPIDALSIAGIIYLFPIFNIFILQKTYELLTGNTIEYLDCLEWIKEYIRRGLMYWDVSVGSYRFTDSAVRRLLARHILYKDPGKFEKIQQIASEYFRSEAQSPGYLHMHLVSAIYHLAQTRREISAQEIGQECLDWVQSNRSFWLSARWADVLVAWQNGAGEKAICDEIRDLIGLKQFNAITRKIKESRKMMEVKK
jgi:predicted AAA+ superfamily ATPase